MLQQPEVLLPLAAPTRSAAATYDKIAYMWNFFVKNEKLKSHGLLQIAANLANFCRKKQWPKNHEFYEDETQYLMLAHYFFDEIN